MPIRKAYGPWEAAVTWIKMSSLGVKLFFAAFTQKTRKLAAEQTVFANLTSLVWRQDLNIFNPLSPATSYDVFSTPPARHMTD